MAIESISTATITGAPRGRPESTAVVPAKAVQAAPGSRPTEQAVGAAQRAAESGDRASRSRLTFDDELSRTFIDVVDEASGEVISRFPPEKIVRHIQKLIEDGKIPGAGAEAGLLVDELV